VSSIIWFRRDLRLGDNPALLEAIAADPNVFALFVIDPVLWPQPGSVRTNYLIDSLTKLNGQLGGHLNIRSGVPAEVVPQFAQEVSASTVHIAADFGPYGHKRDTSVETALHEIGADLIRTGSPYAVAPGRVLKGDGTPYRVFTPFYKAWGTHGWRQPADSIPADFTFGSASTEQIPQPIEIPGITLPPAGEAAAWERWREFKKSALADYPDGRNRPDLAGTSSLSHHLKYGEIHPRSLLAELGEIDEVFKKEICWREFYADVLFNTPTSTHVSLNEKFDTNMPWASGVDADARVEAWKQGRTGFPFVDAGMRQLLSEGWIHNRLRMVVASFLIKDLHIPWQVGAPWFMQWLRDGDIASNTHGWQWTAGCGTDASPFYRVFNPITQGIKFDPNGDYVRRYIPELAHLPGVTAHQPWDAPDGYTHDYPKPVVDHKVEREVALADYAVAREKSQNSNS
jgi:deoxyribodipyrimidine photo-lyase